jgi:hypothetical protein
MALELHGVVSLHPQNLRNFAVCSMRDKPCLVAHFFRLRDMRDKTGFPLLKLVAQVVRDTCARLFSRCRARYV